MSDTAQKDDQNIDFKFRPCPQCQKLAVKEYHPFCSKRCADIDLSKWLNGSYAIPVSEEEPSAEHFDRDI